MRLRLLADNHLAVAVRTGKPAPVVAHSTGPNAASRRPEGSRAEAAVVGAICRWSVGACCSRRRLINHCPQSPAHIVASCGPGSTENCSPWAFGSAKHFWLLHFDLAHRPSARHSPSPAPRLDSQRSSGSCLSPQHAASRCKLHLYQRRRRRRRGRSGAGWCSSKPTARRSPDQRRRSRTYSGHWLRLAALNLLSVFARETRAIAQNAGGAAHLGGNSEAEASAIVILCAGSQSFSSA
jgi:hypothetical protein